MSLRSAVQEHRTAGFGFLRSATAEGSFGFKLPGHANGPVLAIQSRNPSLFRFDHARNVHDKTYIIISRGCTHNTRPQRHRIIEAFRKTMLVPRLAAVFRDAASFSFFDTCKRFCAQLSASLPFSHYRYGCRHYRSGSITNSNPTRKLGQISLDL
jgi:hypothetical protein